MHAYNTSWCGHDTASHTTDFSMQKLSQEGGTPRCSSRSSSSWQRQADVCLLLCNAVVKSAVVQAPPRLLLVATVSVFQNSSGTAAWVAWENIHRRWYKGENNKIVSCRVDQEQEFLLHVPHMHIGLEHHTFYCKLSLVCQTPQTPSHHFCSLLADVWRGNYPLP